MILDLLAKYSDPPPPPMRLFCFEFSFGKVQRRVQRGDLDSSDRACFRAWSAGRWAVESATGTWDTELA